MKLFCYYALHSFLGTLRKLFKTWVAVFFAVCILFGVVVGIGAGILGEAIEETDPTEENYIEEEIFAEKDPEDSLPAVEAIVCAGLLLLTFLSLWNGEKSGNQIFTMADVNLLFPSPRMPQSILLFRLCTRMGVYLVSCLYFIFQIPNLIWNLSLPPAVAWSLMGVLFFALLFHQLFSMLIFSLTASNEKLRGKIRYLPYALLALLALGLFLYCKKEGASLLDGALAIGAMPLLRYVPVIGWLKAVPILIYEGRWLALSLDIAFLILTCLLLIRLIWGLKVDFYEDALQKATELADAQRKIEESGKGVAVGRTKDRSEKLNRELSLKGQGASVFLFKPLLNRFRLAKLGLFTNTGIVYLFCGIAFPLFARFVADSRSSLWIAAPFSLVIFIRAFGNPIVEDISKSFFLLIPEKAYSKVFYSSLGGTALAALDLLPGLLLGWVILGCPSYKILVWLLFLMCFDFYAASFGMFSDLSLPEAIPQKIKSSVQVLLIYFSVVPGAIVIAVGAVLNLTFFFLLLASGVHLTLGLLFTYFGTALLTHGRK